MSFNADECDVLRKDLDTLFKEVHQKTGIHLSMGTMTYGVDVTFKVTAKKIAANVDPQLESFKQSLQKYGKPFGLSEKDFLKPLVDMHGKKLLLMGIKPRARKHPLIVKKINGKYYRYSSDILDNNNVK